MPNKPEQNKKSLAVSKAQQKLQNPKSKRKKKR
jgi:hypothetical protein